MKTILFALAIAATAGSAAVTNARAQDDRPCGSVPVENWMSENALREHLASLNMTVEDIDVEDGCYEVELRNADGQELEILFHPETGEQVRVEG